MDRVVCNYNTRTCSITKLFVPIKHQGKGIGSRELLKMEDILRQHGCKRSRVYVGSLDGFTPPASEFYRKNGYVHYYPNTRNWLTQTFNWPRQGVPQGGMMFKQL